MKKIIFLLIVFFTGIYANAQTFVWAKKSPGTSTDITTDSLGNIYRVGHFGAGTYDFDPGPWGL